jgi:hypothetical protein
MVLVPVVAVGIVFFIVFKNVCHASTVVHHSV